MARPSLFEDRRIDSFTIIAHVDAEPLALVPDVHLDVAGLGVAEGVP